MGKPESGRRTLYSEPRTERMTIAKAEITTLYKKHGVRAIALSMDGCCLGWRSVPGPGVQGRDDRLHVGDLMIVKGCCRMSGIGSLLEKGGHKSANTES